MIKALTFVLLVVAIVGMFNVCMMDAGDVEEDTNENEYSGPVGIDDDEAYFRKTGITRVRIDG